MVLDTEGQPVRLTDEQGVVTAIGYNWDGQPLVVREALGTAEERVTRYQYDKRGRTPRDAKVEPAVREVSPARSRVRELLKVTASD